MNENILFITIVIILSIVIFAAISIIFYLIFKDKKRVQTSSTTDFDFSKIQENFAEKIKHVEEKLNDARKEILDRETNNNNTLIAKLSEIGTNSTNSQNSLQELVNKFVKVSNETNKIQNVIDSVQKIDNYFINNSKARGSFGEFILEQILEDVFGPSSEFGIWQKQYKFKKQSLTADVLLRFGEGRGNIVIDSKFPIVDFKNYANDSEDDSFNNLKDSIVRSIKDVKKYLSDEENVRCAMIFIPSETIYSIVIDKFGDEFFKKIDDKSKVLIVSPTTLLISIIVLNEFLIKENFLKNYELILKDLGDMRKSLDSFKKSYVDYDKRFKTTYNSWKELSKEFDNFIKKLDNLIKNDNNELT